MHGVRTVVQQTGRQTLNRPIEVALGVGMLVLAEADRVVVGGEVHGVPVTGWLFPQEFDRHALRWRRIRPAAPLVRVRACQGNFGQELGDGVFHGLPQQERLVGHAGAASQVGRPVRSLEGGSDLLDPLVGAGDGDHEYGVGEVVAAGDDGGALVLAAAGGRGEAGGEASADGVVVGKENTGPVDPDGEFQLGVAVECGAAGQAFGGGQNAGQA